MRRLSLSVFITLCCLSSVWASDFGFTKSQAQAAQITIFSPPEVSLRGSALAIRARPGSTALPDSQALELAMERGLSSEFKIAKAPADLVLEYAASFEQPTARTYTVTEARNVQVGTKPMKVPLLGTIDMPVYESRPVPVGYWEARGSLNLVVTVTDSTGALVDTFESKGDVAQKIETSAGGVSSSNAALPTTQALQANLYDAVASKLKQRYTRTSQSVQVRLAVDEPLKSGNAQAMTGQWKKALETWTAVQLKRNQQDRTYNMAVAYEALAYQAYNNSGDPNDAEEFFQQALKLYDEALRLDPKEANFRSAQVRCAEMRTNFSRANEQYASHQRETELEVARAETKRREAEDALLKQARPDTKDEADFREYVRKRIRAMSGDPNQDELIKQGGVIYGLTGDLSRRVVLQELDRVEKGRANLEIYQATFSDFVADRNVDATDRQALTRLVQRLQLNQADVKAVESRFQFTEPTTSPVASKANSVAESTPKPAAPKAGPAAGSTPPAKPAAVAPAPSSVPDPSRPPATPATPRIVK